MRSRSHRIAEAQNEHVHDVLRTHTASHGVKPCGGGFAELSWPHVHGGAHDASHARPRHIGQSSRPLNLGGPGRCGRLNAMRTRRRPPRCMRPHARRSRSGRPGAAPGRATARWGPAARMQATCRSPPAVPTFCCWPVRAQTIEAHITRRPDRPCQDPHAQHGDRPTASLHARARIACMRARAAHPPVSLLEGKKLNVIVGSRNFVIDRPMHDDDR